jgi:hypothetical protein
MGRELEIYINSEIDRVVSENASTTLNFTAILSGSKIIKIYPNERRCKIKLNQVEVPNTLYNFPPNQNRLNIVVYDASGNPDSLEFVELDPDRVYNTPADVINYLNAEFLAHPNSVMNDLELSFSDLTKKVSIENNSTVNVRVVSSFRYAGDTADGLGTTFNTVVDRLGFSDNYTNTVIAPTATLTGNGTIRMLFTHAYYIVLNELASSYDQTIIPTPNINRKILGRLTCGNYGTLSQLSYVSEVMMNIPSGIEINRLSFSLLDDEFVPVDLVNQKITMSMKLLIEE